MDSLSKRACNERLDDIELFCISILGISGKQVNTVTHDNSGMMFRMLAPSPETWQARERSIEGNLLKGNHDQGCVQAVPVAAMIHDTHSIEEAVFELAVAIVCVPVHHREKCSKLVTCREKVLRNHVLIAVTEKGSLNKFPSLLQSNVLVALYFCSSFSFEGQLISRCSVRQTVKFGACILLLCSGTLSLLKPCKVSSLVTHWLLAFLEKCFSALAIQSLKRLNSTDKACLYASLRFAPGNHVWQMNTLRNYTMQTMIVQVFLVPYTMFWERMLSV